MKTTLKVILFSSFVGIVLACLFFFNVKEKAEAKNKPILYAFQVGVFKNRDNATLFKEKYKTSALIYDGEYYRVYIGVTTNNKEELESLFNQEGYHYYIKELEVTSGLYAEMEKYDYLLKNSSEESKFSIIQKMLESVSNELQN